jgi:hypothetical protein
VPPGGTRVGRAEAKGGTGELDEPRSDTRMSRAAPCRPSPTEPLTCVDAQDMSQDRNSHRGFPDKRDAGSKARNVKVAVLVVTGGTVPHLRASDHV